MRSHAETVFAVVGYAACSSVMLVINKLAVHLLPAPAFVLLAQVTVSWISVKAVGMTGAIDVDELEYDKARSFFPVAAAFLACIFANIKTLQYANVETFIVFRAATPLVIGVAEWALMGRELPNRRSAFAMLILAGGACLYVLTDAAFVVHGYVWVGVWFMIFCFDQLYIKHAVDSTPMRSNWGRVFYTNLWACVLLLAIVLLTEPHVLKTFHWGTAPLLALLASCTAGVAMSYFAFLCRSAVSATSFTVIGNVCKILTVLINIAIWDKHASPSGLVGLFICLGAAALYQQSPLREDTHPKRNIVGSGDKEAAAQSRPLTSPGVDVDDVDDPIEAPADKAGTRDGPTPGASMAR
jgi:solute carrier family 35 protein